MGSFLKNFNFLLINLVAKTGMVLWHNGNFDGRLVVQGISIFLLPAVLAWIIQCHRLD
jgi:hypothetical protein